MKKTQLCRPVLIEMAEASNLYLHNNMLYNFEAVEHTPGQDNGSNQYLVLVSLDSESKVVATHNQLPLKYIKKVVKEYNFYSELKDVEIEVECKNMQPQLTNGFVTIIDEVKQLSEDWEALLAIKNIPELPHIINSVKELRRYYIDGLQVGYNVGKSETSLHIEEVTYTKKDLKDAWDAGYNKAVSSINEDRFDEDDNAPDYNTWFNKKKK